MLVGLVMTAVTCLAFYLEYGPGEAIGGAVMGAGGLLLLWFIAPAVEIRPQGRSADPAAKRPSPLWRRILGLILKLMFYYLAAASAVHRYGWRGVLVILAGALTVILLLASWPRIETRWKSLFPRKPRRTTTLP